MTVSAAEAGHKRAPDRLPSLYLEREGERRIARMLRAVEKVPWGIGLLQLAWTAGPVTFIAAQGGYLIGYGKALPLNTLVFFIGYTVIAGVAGLLAKPLYEATSGRKLRRRQRALTTALDRFPELVFAVRDLSLEPLPPERRKREAAWLLLRKAELDADGMAMAVQDLTDSSRLAHTASQVEIYRRAGLHHRAADLLEADAAQIRLVLEELDAAAPEMAASLRERLYEGPPTLKRGIPREPNFIERILAASDEGNEALMTLRDVEEMLVLAFELINGREIPMLIFGYRGRWTLAEATDALEAARSDYRIARATGYSRLQALVTFLAENGVEMGEAVAGQSLPTLLESARAGMGALVEEVHGLRRQVEEGARVELETLRERVEVLAAAVRLYRAMQRAHRGLRQRHENFLRARTRWDEVAGHYGDSATALRTGRGAHGLRIRERTIRLDDEERLEVAEALMDSLREIDLRHRPRPQHHEGAEPEPLSSDGAKRLAIEVALVLEQHIHLGRPEIQRAIYSANAAHLGALQPGLSATAKAAFGAAVIKEVRKDMAKAAEQLASALVRYYRVALTEEAMQFLSRTYGADPQTLQVLADYAEQSPTVPAATLGSPPPAAPRFEPQWQWQLNRARTVLNRYEQT